MTGSAWVVGRRFFPLFGLCLALQLCAGESPAYHQSVSLVDGQPVLDLTNDSKFPITAFVMVEFPSLGIEGRTYFDVYTNTREQPIPPGASTTRNLSFLGGSDLTKVRAEVRGVIFEDGSTAGDPIWINAVLARRLHLYHRLLSLHDLLRKRGGTGVPHEEIISLLRAAQAEADQQTADDDLRIEDDVEFQAGTLAFHTNRKLSVPVVLKAYLQSLEKRTTKVEYSRPDLDSIRDVPGSIPAPLSQASLPIEFWHLVSALSAKGKKTPGGLSSCAALGANFVFPAIAGTTCYGPNQQDLGPTTNTYKSFSTTFTYYDGSTGKLSDKPWLWQPGQNDLDTAYGECHAYYDCNDNPQVYYPANPTATGQEAANVSSRVKVTQGQNPAPFYWTFDNYPDPTSLSCNDCDCPSCVQGVSSTNSPQPGVTFYFNYACVVTP